MIQPKFNGPTYEDADFARLKNQHDVIRELMLDGVWRTLPEIERATGYPQASISAQLRHMRKQRFGEYRVDKTHFEEGPGTWYYRVLPPLPKGQLYLYEEKTKGAKL